MFFPDDYYVTSTADFRFLLNPVWAMAMFAMFRQIHSRRAASWHIFSILSHQDT